MIVIGPHKLLISTNNSKCRCPATALGPDKTAATCSAIGGTPGMKEQISCVTSRRFVRATPRQHVDGRAPDAAACSIIFRADRDGALALFVGANRNGLLWPTFSSAIGSILCLSVSLDLLPSLPMNTEWRKKYVPPRCRAMSCQGQCQAA